MQTNSLIPPKKFKFLKQPWKVFLKLIPTHFPVSPLISYITSPTRGCLCSIHCCFPSLEQSLETLSAIFCWLAAWVSAYSSTFRLREDGPHPRSQPLENTIYQIHTKYIYWKIHGCPFITWDLQHGVTCDPKHPLPWLTWVRPQAPHLSFTISLKPKPTVSEYPVG